MICKIHPAPEVLSDDALVLRHLQKCSISLQ